MGFHHCIALRQCCWKASPSTSGRSRNSRACCRPLANRLTVARTHGSRIVALTAEEREQILMAIERNPGRLDYDLRHLILRQTSWRRR